jgi:ribose/xylose/arabinose/galactoside ABC-type transport system permease subunit
MTDPAGPRTIPLPAMVPWAILAALAAGLAIGLLNGAAVTALAMPPFIVTLSTMMIVSGAALWWTKSKNIANLPESFVNLAAGNLLAIPSPVWVVALLAIATHLLLSRTLWGYWLHATGHNPRAALVSGVPVRRITVAAYACSGLCAAVAALLYTARLESGSPTMGREILLDVVGATVIGGTSLFGGRGRVLWTVSGVLLFSLIDNSLNLLGLEYYTIWTVKGLVILAAAALDLLRARVLAGA